MINQRDICVEAWDIIRKTTQGGATAEELARLKELQASCECNDAADVTEFTRDGERCERCGKYL